MAKCKDYSPGEEMGKEKPVCIHYLKNGACSLQSHFMCEYILDKPYYKSRGGLAIRCKLTMKWMLREDCKECKDFDKFCGV